MSKKIRTLEVEDLFNAILALKDTEECFQFFEDLCTTNEILSFAQRYQVAKMLDDKFTYQDIAERSGASTATISRVKRAIDDGSGGYRMMFERLNQEKDQ